MRIAVLGAGGFIGGWLCEKLSADGHQVVGVDSKLMSQWWRPLPRTAAGINANFLHLKSVATAIAGCDQVYHLAADMGGRDYIETFEARCALNAAIDLNVLQACAASPNKPRLFYASSACVYPAYLQHSGGATELAERHAGPPYHPDGVYGMAKLYGEMSAKAFAKAYGLDVRIARFHGVYGPHGSWNDGREKAPAALCRKIAHAVQTGASEIEVWGDGSQIRPYMYVTDLVDGMLAIMAAEMPPPVLNLGADEAVSIAEIVRTILDIASADVKVRFQPDKPTGPHTRGSDNTLIRRVLPDWKPKVSLREGLTETYRWIAAELAKSEQEPADAA